MCAPTQTCTHVQTDRHINKINVKMWITTFAYWLSSWGNWKWYIVGKTHNRFQKLEKKFQDKVIAGWPHFPHHVQREVSEFIHSAARDWITTSSGAFTGAQRGSTEPCRLQPFRSTGLLGRKRLSAVEAMAHRNCHEETAGSPSHIAWGLSWSSVQYGIAEKRCLTVVSTQVMLSPTTMLFYALSSLKPITSPPF